MYVGVAATAPGHAQAFSAALVRAARSLAAPSPPWGCLDAGTTLNTVISCSAVEHACTGADHVGEWNQWKYSQEWLRPMS